MINIFLVCTRLINTVQGYIYDLHKITSKFYNQMKLQTLNVARQHLVL